MIITNPGVIPDYNCLYRTVKPLYAYYKILTDLVRKSEHHSTVFGIHELVPLIQLARRVTSLEVPPSLVESFCVCRFFESKKLINMSSDQQLAKKRLFSILKVNPFSTSAETLIYLLEMRAEIIKEVSRSYFALPIPSVCLNIVYQLLFSAGAEQNIKRLGSGAYGSVDAVRLFYQSLAKKTLLEDYPGQLQRNVLSRARLTIQMANPNICEFFFSETNKFFYELGLSDCNAIISELESLKNFLSSISKYAEDLLQGFSIMHFGFKSMGITTLKKRCNPLSKETHIPLFKGMPPVVHGDFKMSNAILVDNPKDRTRHVKIIDIDTANYDGYETLRVTCTYNYNPPEAAQAYINPSGFRRKISIYDDSWSLGCSLYSVFFQKELIRINRLDSGVKILREVAAISQAMISEILSKPIQEGVYFYLGTQDFNDCLDYLRTKATQPQFSHQELQRLRIKLGMREFKRQLGILKGLLTVNIQHRLTIDEAHNIYFVAERKLNPTLDRKLKIDALSKLNRKALYQIERVAKNALLIRAQRRSKFSADRQLTTLQEITLKKGFEKKLKQQRIKKLKVIAEKLLGPARAVDFDHSTPNMGYELGLFHSNFTYIPLKIERKVRLIQKVYRNYLALKRTLS
jgi:serine/threonine protein kinase